MLSQLEQIVGIGHRSCPRLFLQNGLLGLTAKIEIGENAPLFKGLESLVNGSCDFVCRLQQLIAAAGSVGKYDSEEDSGVSAPILPKGIPQAYHIGAKRPLDFVDSLVELRLLCKRSGDIHILIIAYR